MPKDNRPALTHAQSVSYYLQTDHKYSSLVCLLSGVDQTYGLWKDQTVNHMLFDIWLLISEFSGLVPSPWRDTSKLLAWLCAHFHKNTSEWLKETKVSVTFWGKDSLSDDLSACWEKIRGFICALSRSQYVYIWTLIKKHVLDEKNTIET